MEDLTVSSSYYFSPSLPQKSLNDYGDEKKLIGKGQYGEIFAYDNKYAIKKIRVRQFDFPPTFFLQEIALLRSLNHKNIIPVYDVIREGLGPIYYVHLVLPLGIMDLRRLANERVLSEEETKAIFHQIVSAVAYLHSNNIVHRDLKPDNIIWREEGYIQLIDFDFAIDIGCKGIVENTIMAYGRWYRPPEVALWKNYDYSADIWALGCIVYELYTEDPLFDVDTDDALVDYIYNIIKYEEPTDNLMDKSVEPDVIAAILDCLKIDPKKRITAHEILALPLFSEFKQEPVTNCYEALKRREAYPVSYRNPQNLSSFSWFYNIIMDHIRVERVYYHAVWLYDRVKPFMKENEELLRTSILLIAMEYAGESVSPDEMLSWSNISLLVEDILRMERSILEQLEYDIRHSLSYDFLFSNSISEEKRKTSLLILLALSMSHIRFDMMPEELANVAIDLTHSYLDKDTLHHYIIEELINVVSESSLLVKEDVLTILRNIY